MTPEQRARFQQILDEYDTAIAAINDADADALDIIAHANDARYSNEQVLAAGRMNLVINKRIMEANRRANDQVRILLNEL
jgi:hypothetical protein